MTYSIMLNIVGLKSCKGIYLDSTYDEYVWLVSIVTNLLIVSVR